MAENAWTARVTVTVSTVNGACPITTCLLHLMKKAGFPVNPVIVILQVRKVAWVSRHIIRGRTSLDVGYYQKFKGIFPGDGLLSTYSE